MSILRSRAEPRASTHGSWLDSSLAHGMARFDMDSLAHATPGTRAINQGFGEQGHDLRERSHTVLLLGRERVRDVLEPHLGPSCALERANNIAQALAVEEAQPDVVAFEMLRQLPGEARRQLAAAVRRAWLAVEFDQFRAARAL